MLFSKIYLTFRLKIRRGYILHHFKEMKMTDIEKEFCERLTDLLLDCGLRIADEPHIYELQSGPDSDYGRTATIDDEGRLHFV
jgi:hypothetical protein